MASFSTPAVKKAIKVAQEMGLIVSSFEITAAGGIKIFTAQEAVTEADTALEHWMRQSDGKG